MTDFVFKCTTLLHKPVMTKTNKQKKSCIKLVTQRYELRWQSYYAGDHNLNENDFVCYNMHEI